MLKHFIKINMYYRYALRLLLKILVGPFRGNNVLQIKRALCLSPMS